MELGKDDTVVYYLQGKNYNRQERYNEAIEALKKSIKKDRNNVAARYELAIAYDKNKDKEHSKMEFQNIIDHPLDTPLKNIVSGKIKK